MNVALLVGVVGAFGVLMVVSGLVPARPPLAEALARLHAPRLDHAADGQRGLLVGRVARPLARSDIGRRLTQPVTRDLRVVGQTAEELIAKELLCALTGLLWAPVTAALMFAGGVRVPYSLPVWLSLALGALGGLLPLISLRTVAAERRRAFRHALGCYLDLVAVRLAGGAGIESALSRSAESGNGWAFAELRQALDEARLTGEPPWAGLDRLGTALGIRELNELASSLTLAGDEGARVRASISAKARAMRIRGLADAESAAQAASERMSLPIVLLMVGFVAFLGYPAVMQVLTGL